MEAAEVLAIEMVACYGMAVGNNSTYAHVTTFSMLNENTPYGWNTKILVGAISGDFYCTALFWSGSHIQNRMPMRNDISAEWWLSEIGVASGTGGCRGVHGRLPDLWWGPAAVRVGGTYPNDVSRQFASFYNIVVPWNGTTPKYS